MHGMAEPFPGLSLSLFVHSTVAGTLDDTTNVQPTSQPVLFHLLHFLTDLYSLRFFDLWPTFFLGRCCTFIRLHVSFRWGSLGFMGIAFCILAPVTPRPQHHRDIDG